MIERIFIGKRFTRSHHSSEIEGYIGSEKYLKHGDIYSTMRNGEFKQFGHGKSDGLTGKDHRAAKKAEANFTRSVRFQKMTEEYRCPPTGY